MIPCCSRVEACSAEGFCINPYKELREECLYKIKLGKGINFYNKKIYSGRPFVKIDGRLFFIGRRSSNPKASYTYDLLEEEKEELKKYMRHFNIKIIEKIDFRFCEVDRTSDSNRACCLVILTVGGKKYNVKNFNTRAVTESTAFHIRDYFRLKGIMAAIQYIGQKSTVKIENTKSKRSNSIDEKAEFIKSNEENELFGQISMFDMGVMS